MERRTNPRYAANQPVRLTVLDSDNTSQPGLMLNLSDGGMQVLLERPLAAGLSVRIDLEDCLLLGESCYCQPAENGYAIGVRIEQVLSGLRDLENLMRTLIGEADAYAQAATRKAASTAAP